MHRNSEISPEKREEFWRKSLESKERLLDAVVGSMLLFLKNGRKDFLSFRLLSHELKVAGDLVVKTRNQLKLVTRFKESS